MSDPARGLYMKFTGITRTDGSSEPGGKHHGCDYFVLDLTHDAHALPALKAYMLSCRREYPHLAVDLYEKIANAPGGMELLLGVQLGERKDA